MKSEKEIRSFMNDLETLSSDCQCHHCTVRSSIILGPRFALDMADDRGRTADAFAEKVALLVAKAKEKSTHDKPT